MLQVKPSWKTWNSPDRMPYPKEYVGVTTRHNSSLGLTVKVKAPTVGTGSRSKREE